MSVLVLWLWIGGLSPAYSLNRRNGMGRIRSAFDALCWPYEMGQYLVKTYYQNEGWKLPRR